MKSTTIRRAGAAGRHAIRAAAGPAACAAARLATGAALALALAACGTTQPSRFFTLVPLAAPAAPAAGASGLGAGVLIGLQSVRIPELVDRPQMMTAISEHERHFDEYHRWAEPLVPHISGVIAENLSALLAPAPVMVDPARDGRTAAVLARVDILHFDVQDAGEAVLTARWSLTVPGGDGKPFAEGTGTWRAPAGSGDPDLLADAMSRNLLELSHVLADALVHHRTG